MSDAPPPPPPGGGDEKPAPPPPPPPYGGYSPPPPPPTPGGPGYGPPPPPAPPGGGYVPPPPPGGGYVPPPPGGFVPAGGYPATYGYAGQRTDGLAIAALVIGIISVACSLGCLGIVLGPTAAIMGFISRQRIATSGGTIGGSTLAIVGLVLGILGFVASVGWFFFIIVSGSLNQSSASPTP